MGLKNKVNAIRCKRPDDVLLVRPGPEAKKVVDALLAGVKCGHGHLVVIGKASFTRREDLPPMPDEIRKRAVIAYQVYPIAKVLVDTLAQQLGVAVDEVMVGDALGHPELLEMIRVGHDKMAAAARDDRQATLFEPDGKALGSA